MSQRNRTNNRKFKSFDDDAFYEDWDNNRKNTKNPRREARRAAEKRRNGWIDRELPWKR